MKSLVLSMVVNNEASSAHLRPTLTVAAEYITSAIIIDDGSADDTVAVCAQELRNIPYRIVHNVKPRFGNEVALRKQQWREAVRTGADWILGLDADQRFENAFKHHVRDMLEAPVDAWHFRLYDFWNETQYRDDAFWSAHRTFRPFLVRNVFGESPAWRETAQHCGTFPLAAEQASFERSPMRLMHMGWVSEEARRFKYERYKKLDPGGKFGWQEQYDSILDPNPHLVDWRETESATISVIINSAALGAKAREQLSSSGIPYGRRALTLRDTILPRLARNAVETVVTGEFERGIGYTYVESHSVAFDATDALQQRADGFAASRGDIVVFQHDDHTMHDDFFQTLRDKYANDPLWDVLVPSRWAIVGDEPRQLNDGRADGYVMGHVCVMRRPMAEAASWTNVRKVHTWDVDHTKLLRAHGARIRWVDDLKVWDLEGRAPGYAW